MKNTNERSETVKKFKGLVKDKQTKERKILEAEANSKTEWLEMVRDNGYSVTNWRVKESHVFDWIMENTNGEKWDYQAGIVE